MTPGLMVMYIYGGRGNKGKKSFQGLLAVMLGKCHFACLHAYFVDKVQGGL